MSSWLLCPMELHCDWKTATSNIQDDKTLNIDVKEFRSKKPVAAVAEPRIRLLQTMKISERHLICERTVCKYQGHAKFDELYLGGESIRN